MKSLFSLIFFMVLSGCTLSINLANTRGENSDLIDSTPYTSVEADPTLSVPASTILGV